MTAAGFRRLALSLPEAAEGSHFGNADFRVEGKIFATLAYEKEGFGVLMLTPEQQAGMVEDAPEIFSPVKGGWGKQGATRVRLAKVRADILEDALRMAWQRRATKNAPRKRKSSKQLSPKFFRGSVSSAARPDRTPAANPSALLR